jgi:hypothetical protein
VERNELFQRFSLDAPMAMAERAGVRPKLVLDSTGSCKMVQPDHWSLGGATPPTQLRRRPDRP